MLKSKLDRRLTVLLRDYGFKVEGKLLIRLPIGYMPAEIMFPVSSLFDACERLIPRIREDEFYSEFRRLTKGN